MEKKVKKRKNTTMQTCSSMPRLLVTLLALTTSTFQQTHAYSHGDPVSMVVRTSSRGVTSGWADIRRSSLPRFGLDTMTDIVPDFQKKTMTTDAAFKLKFSMSDRRFLLPWTDIADGSGMFAETIVFDMNYMGNDVRSVHVRVETSETATKTPPSRIMIRYEWHEIPSTDEEMGLRVVFATSVVLALAGVLVTICW
jgi:hypothetical protein